MEKKDSVIKPLFWLALIFVLVIIFNRVDSVMIEIVKMNYNNFYTPRQLTLLAFYTIFGILAYNYGNSLKRKSSLVYFILLDIVAIFYLFLTIIYGMRLDINLNYEIINRFFIVMYSNVSYLYILAGITFARLISTRRE